MIWEATWKSFCTSRRKKKSHSQCIWPSNLQKWFFTILNQSGEPKLGSSIHSNNLHAIIFRTFMILKISNFRTCICRRKKKKMISIPYYIITRYQKLVHWAFLHQGKKELKFFLRWTQSLLWNFRCLKELKFWKFINEICTTAIMLLSSICYHNIIFWWCVMLLFKLKVLKIKLSSCLSSF